MTLKGFEDVETVDPENEIWHYYLNKFSNYRYANNLLAPMRKKCKSLPTSQGKPRISISHTKMFPLLLNLSCCFIPLKGWHLC
jgi:hypothetical protein